MGGAIKVYEGDSVKPCAAEIRWEVWYLESSDHDDAGH